MSISIKSSRARSDSTEVVFVRLFACVEREIGRLDERSPCLEPGVERAVEVCFEILPERVALAGADGMVAVRQGR